MNRQLGRGAFFLAIGNIAFITAGYLTNLWLARRLGPSKYGVYGVLTAILTLLNLVQTSGLPTALSREIAHRNSKPKEALLNAFVIQLATITILILLIIIIAPLLAGLLHEQASVNLVRLIALVLPFYGIFALYMGFYNGLHNFGRQAILNTTYSLLKVLLIILFTIKFGLTGVLYGFVISPLIALLTGWVMPRGKIHLGLVKKLYFDSVPLTTFSVVASLQLAIDLLLVKGMVISPAAAGVYSACQSIAMIPYFGMSSISQVIFPGLAKYHNEKNIAEIRSTITSGFKHITMLVVPFCLIVAALAPQVINLLFGRSYEDGVASLRILMVAYMFLTIYMVMASSLNAIGRTMHSILFSSFGVGVTTVLCVLLIPHYQLIGASSSVAIAAIIISIASISYVRKQTKFKIPIRSLLLISFFSVSLSLLAYLIAPSVTLSPFVGFFAVVIYIGCLELSGELKVLPQTFLSRRAN
jgi:O-antigen/teichoic acid export membrane protein